MTGLIAELQRLARRARVRWLPVVAIAVLLTAGILYKRSRKTHLKRARVVLAATEGSMGDSLVPMPQGELRDYIVNILLSSDVLRLDLLIGEVLRDGPTMTDAEVADEVRRRAEPVDIKIPQDSVLASWIATQRENPLTDDDLATDPDDLLEMTGINVYRNYFLMAYYAEAPRSARILVVVSDPDPELANHEAHRLAELIKAGEARRRLALGEALAADAASALAAVRTQADELDALIVKRRVELAAAEDAGEAGKAAALRVGVEELRSKRRSADEKMLGLTSLASAEEQAAAIDRAGLGIKFELVEERRAPEDSGTRTYLRVLQAALLFGMLLPLTAIIIGTFDPRIHDREDVERIGLPVLGHVPAFPGDRVGSLRARGVRGRRVPS